MAMFGKVESPTSGSRSSGGNLSFIGRDITFVGNVGGSGNLHIDGRIEGDITAASVIVGAEGHVRGNIYAELAQIAGTVEGTVSAKSLVVEGSARIAGDLSYDSVTVASGAQVDGRMKRLTRDAEPSLKLIASE